MWATGWSSCCGPCRIRDRCASSSTIRRQSALSPATRRCRTWMEASGAPNANPWSSRRCREHRWTAFISAVNGISQPPASHCADAASPCTNPISNPLNAISWSASSVPHSAPAAKPANVRAISNFVTRKSSAKPSAPGLTPSRWTWRATVYRASCTPSRCTVTTAMTMALSSS